MKLTTLTMPGARCLLARELGRLARARWFYMTRTGVLLLTLLTMLFPFAFAVTPGTTSSFAARAMIGGWVFATVHVVALIISMFTVPAICAGAIAGERQQGTADVLRATPLSALELVLGLAGGRLLALIVLALSLAPAFAVCVAIGGVTADMMLGSMAAQLLFIVWLAALCTMVSSRSPNATVAARRSFGLLLVFAVALPMLSGITTVVLTMYGRGLPLALTGWLDWASPLRGCFVGFSSLSGTDPTPTVFTAGWQSALALVVATRSIRRNLVIEASAPRRRKVTSSDDASHGRIVSTPKRRILTPRGNPILWRERIAQASRKNTAVARVGFATAAVATLIISYSVARKVSSTNEVVPLVGLSTLFLLMACIRLSIRVSTSLTTEIAASRLEPLLTTSLDRGQILRGHVLIALRHSLPPIALMAAITLPLALAIDAGDGIRMIWGCICAMIGAMSITLAVAALFSTSRSSPMAATIRPLVLLFALCAGYPFVLQALMVWGAPNNVATYYEHLVYVHPFAQLFMFANPGAPSMFIATMSSGVMAVLAIVSVIGAERRFARAPTEKWLGAATRGRGADS